MSIDSDDLLGSASAYCKFENIGDKFTLRIDHVAKQQQTEYATGVPLTWPDGKPKMEHVFTCTDLATGEETRLFVKGGVHTAVVEALHAAGAAKGAPIIGYELVIKYDHNEPSQTKGFNDRKVYRAKATPPVSSPADDLDLL